VDDVLLAGSSTVRRRLREVDSYLTRQIALRMIWIVAFEERS